MRNNVFKTVQSSKGTMVIKSDDCENGITYSEGTKSDIVVILWKSPHASLKRNQQLERDLYRIYRKYYIRVMLESFGRFW